MRTIINGMTKSLSHGVGGKAAVPQTVKTFGTGTANAGSGPMG